MPIYNWFPILVVWLVALVSTKGPRFVKQGAFALDLMGYIEVQFFQSPKEEL